MNNPIDQKVATVLQSYTVLAIIALLIGAGGKSPADAPKPPGGSAGGGRSGGGGGYPDLVGLRS